MTFEAPETRDLILSQFYSNAEFAFMMFFRRKGVYELVQAKGLKGVLDSINSPAVVSALCLLTADTDMPPTIQSIVAERVQSMFQGP
jgi:hypothetical protein